jgi:hypothetical protein
MFTKLPCRKRTLIIISLIIIIYFCICASFIALFPIQSNKFKIRREINNNKQNVINIDNLNISHSSLLSNSTIKTNDNNDIKEKDKIDKKIDKINNNQSDNNKYNNIINNNIIISRLSNVLATCDVKGNLGDCNVVIQNTPGKDWIKDRWQAASDMGGTSIRGNHWIILDFINNVKNINKIELDWESAYCEDYRLEIKLNNDNTNEWFVIYNATNSNDIIRRKTIKSGQSPGVKYEMPLHIKHIINFNNIDNNPFRYLRLFIVKPANFWGVSLWQFDVYGEVNN